MTLFFRPFPWTWILFLALILTTAEGQSASRLDYITASEGPRTLEIQGGHARLLRALNGRNIDVHFDAGGREWTIVDHDRQRLMPLNEASLRGLSAKIGLLGPLLGGIREQLPQLNSGQRQKWAAALDGLPLDWLQAPSKKAKASNSTLRPHTRTLLGIPCKEQSLEMGQHTVLLCLAKSETLPMAQEDRDTLKVMEKSAHGLILLAGQMARQIGLALTSEDPAHLLGIPLQIRTDRTEGPPEIRLSSIRSVARQSDFESVPAHYHLKPLTLW